MPSQKRKQAKKKAKCAKAAAKQTAEAEKRAAEQATRDASLDCTRQRLQAAVLEHDEKRDAGKAVKACTCVTLSLNGAQHNFAQGAKLCISLHTNAVNAHGGGFALPLAMRRFDTWADAKTMFRRFELLQDIPPRDRASYSDSGEQCFHAWPATPPALTAQSRRTCDEYSATFEYVMLMRAKMRSASTTSEEIAKFKTAGRKFLILDKLLQTQLLPQLQQREAKTISVFTEAVRAIIEGKTDTV